MKRFLYLLLLLPAFCFGQNQRIVDLSGMAQSGATGSISATVNSITLTTTQGFASNITTFTTSGTGLTATGAATCPSWMEISLDQINWSQILNLSVSAGIFVGQPILISSRITSTTLAGPYTGTLTIASSGSTPKNITLTGTVNSPSGVTNDTLNINVWDSVNNIGKVNLAAPTFWNEWNINESTNPISFQFKYQTGVQSPITAKFDAINSYVDNGNNYNSGTTSGYPISAFRVTVFNTTTPNTLTLGALPTATNGYRVEFLVSRSTATTRPMTIQIGAQSVTRDAMNNDVTFVFDNLTPTAGNLVFNLSSTNGFWFINGFRIIKKN